MEVVSRDWVMAQKEKRRAELDLEYHAHGDCIHVGKISNGCKECFVRTPETSFSIYTGCECNVQCGYCYYDVNRTDKSWNSMSRISNNLADLYAIVVGNNNNLRRVSYNSFGETLMYPSVIKEASDLLLRYEEDRGVRIYSHLYTNGMFADEKMLKFLKDCRVTELRFHLSASHFSKSVVNNMIKAKEMGFIITVEEPSLPENKDMIMKHLPVFEEIGLDHLDIVECQVTADNKEYLESTYPEGKIYRDLLWHFYDEGMVYDIIKEVQTKGYKYSVIDCNSRVEVCRDSKQMAVPSLYDMSMMEGAFRESPWDNSN